MIKLKVYQILLHNYLYVSLNKALGSLTLARLSTITQTTAVLILVPWMAQTIRIAQGAEAGTASVTVAGVFDIDIVISLKTKRRNINLTKGKRMTSF